MLLGLIIILIIAVILLVIKNIKTQQNIKIQNELVEDNKTDEIMPYNKKLLLTKNEWAFYKKIKPICNKYNLHIISKVRLADLVEVKKDLDYKDKQKYFNKIKNKHIDFVLCNPDNLAVIALIELDDKTHERQDRIERDKFVNKLCDEVGYIIIRTYQNDDFEKLLESKCIIHKDLETDTAQIDLKGWLIKPDLCNAK